MEDSIIKCLVEYRVRTTGEVDRRFVETNVRLTDWELALDIAPKHGLSADDIEILDYEYWG